MTLQLRREPDGSITMIDGEQLHQRVRVVRAAPLSHPDRYISLVDANEDEIMMVGNLADLDEPTRTVLQEELTRLAAVTIQRVMTGRSEGGVAYMKVETSLGECDLVVHDIDERVRQFGDRLTVRDVDDRLYQILSLSRLDARSIKLIERVLLQT